MNQFARIVLTVFISLTVVYGQADNTDQGRPVVEILSPKIGELLVRPVGKSTSFEVTIRAKDSDGSIVKVVLRSMYDNPIPMIVGGQAKWIYRGQTYAGPELQRAMLANPPPERVARRTGPDTFAYTFTELPWGQNHVSVEATDNSGVVGYESVPFIVNSDSTIEIVSPKKDEIVAPGSTVVIETITRTNGAALKEVRLGGQELPKTARPTLVSRQGNEYRHRYVWNNVPETQGYSVLRAQLVEASGATSDAQEIGFLPRSLPKISFTSIQDGQEISRAEMISIDYQIAGDNFGNWYEMYIDGISQATIVSTGGFNWLNPETGRHTIQIVAKLAPGRLELTRSKLITVYVR